MSRMAVVFIGIGSLLLGVVGARQFTGSANPRSSGLPVAVVVSDHQRVTAASDEMKVRALFEVVNTGNSPLSLGTAKTSCGCVVASVTPTTLAPAEKAKVVLEGMPPVSGEKTVQATIETNSTTGPVIVRMTMVGAAEPPYVLSTDGPLRFGVTRRSEQRGAITIRTQERPHTQVWLGSVLEKPEDVEVRGGLVPESRAPTGDLVIREYRYELVVYGLPKQGPFGGAFLLGSPGDSGARVHRVDFDGIVRPAIFPSPSRIYVSLEKEERPAPIKLSIHSDEPDFRLQVAPRKEAGAPYDLNCIEKRDQRIVYRLTFPTVVSMTSDSVVVFETNHPDYPIVRVPVTLRLTTGATSSPNAR